MRHATNMCRSHWQIAMKCHERSFHVFSLVSLYVNSLGVWAFDFESQDEVHCLAEWPSNTTFVGTKSSFTCSKKMNLFSFHSLPHVTATCSLYVGLVQNTSRLHFCCPTTFCAGWHLLPLASNESCSDLMVWLGLDWCPSNSSPKKPPCESWLLVCQSVEVRSSSESLVKWIVKGWTCATVQRRRIVEFKLHSNTSVSTILARSHQIILHKIHKSSSPLEIYTFNYSKSYAIIYVSRLICASAPSALTCSMEGQTSDYQTVMWRRHMSHMDCRRANILCASLEELPHLDT